jgi:hypothetical protein
MLLAQNGYFTNEVSNVNKCALPAGVELCGYDLCGAGQISAKSMASSYGNIQDYKIEKDEVAWSAFKSQIAAGKEKNVVAASSTPGKSSGNAGAVHRHPRTAAAIASSTPIMAEIKTTNVF